MKICNKCGIEKNSDEFYKNYSLCKLCKKEYRSKYIKENKTKISNSRKDYYQDNKNLFENYYQENIDKIKNYYQENKEDIKKYRKNYYLENIDREKEKSKNYYENNKEYYQKYYQSYYKEHSSKEDLKNNKTNIIADTKKEYSRLYMSYKRKTDPIFKLKENLRNLIKNSLNNKGFKKINKTEIILGCSIEDFKIYLESKFEDWMSWDNYGLYNGNFNYGWDIDHIIPLASSINEVEVINLNNYENLQPLCSFKNRNIKKNNIYK